MMLMAPALQSHSHAAAISQSSTSQKHRHTDRLFCCARGTALSITVRPAHLACKKPFPVTMLPRRLYTCSGTAQYPWEMHTFPRLRICWGACLIARPSGYSLESSEACVDHCQWSGRAGWGWVGWGGAGGLRGGARSTGQPLWCF